MDRTLPPLPEPVALYKLTVTGYLHETAPTTAASNLADGDYLLYAAPQPAPARPCTCNPGDNPPQPCAQQYALLECRAAASEKPRAADHGAPAAQHQHKGYIAGLPGWNYPDAGDPLPAGGDKCLLLTKGGVCIGILVHETVSNENQAALDITVAILNCISGGFLLYLGIASLLVPWFVSNEALRDASNLYASMAYAGLAIGIAAMTAIALME